MNALAFLAAIMLAALQPSAPSDRVTVEQAMQIVCHELAVDCSEIPAPVVIENESIGATMHEGQVRGVLGGYVPATRTIYLDPLLSLIPLYHSHVLIHEVTHYIDDRDGTSLSVKPSRPEMCAAEEKAHRVQHTWLIRTGHWEIAARDRNWRSLYGCDQ